MEEEIKWIRICSFCRWASNALVPNMLVCARAIPTHIPNKQIFAFRKALVKRHWDLDCEKFHSKYLC